MQRIVFLFLLISQCAFGQFFVVKDKDGYVNIRERKASKVKYWGHSLIINLFIYFMLMKI